MTAIRRTEKRKRPRTCVGCGEESPKRALLRVVRRPDGIVTYDSTGRTNGRGAYVCCCSECVRLARKKKAFSRVLGVQVDDAIYDELDRICKAAEIND